MRFFYSSIAATAVATFLPSAFAQIVQYTPSGLDGISFSVNVPDQTVSSGPEPVYLQIKGPSDVQWLAVGEGSRMLDSNMLVIYASSNNNITLSPRLGSGHTQPLFNPDAQVSLLDGSGISNGIMTANIRCDSFLSWSGGSENVKSASAPFIWAVRHGEPLESASVSEGIHMHDKYGGFSVDFAEATGGNTDNPFSDSSLSISIASATGSSGHQKRTAHAIILSVVFVLLFPSFALTLHLFPSSKTVPFIHAPLQLFALAAAIVGLALGISIGKSRVSDYHPVIGIVVIGALVLFQPILGLLQHLHYRKHGTKSLFAYIHRWLGRVLVILGIINGGLGFKYAGIGRAVPSSAVIAYGVIAGLMGVGYIFLIIQSTLRARRLAILLNFDGACVGPCPLSSPESGVVPFLLQANSPCIAHATPSRH
ncbi:hypothetical protein VTN77DRAFT_1787 [Rasamsonia byssochlamydoides]|uniref:uncharacterized protein n=1 Tax=Rasamsonia byssochlamydoides TaxID=89139 RepID=UPI003744AADA